MRRGTLEPDELAAAFDQMQRKGLVEGLFLSSGIIGTVRTMDRMLATVELVRKKYGWRGYVHLKILPNAEEAQIEQAARLADRLSVNLEAPNEMRLARLAPKKEFDHGLIEPLQRAWTIVRRLRNRGLSWPRPAPPPNTSSGRPARATRSCSTPAKCSIGKPACAGPTTPPSIPLTILRSKMSKPRPLYASIASIRRTLCCDNMAIASKSCPSIRRQPVARP